MREALRIRPAVAGDARGIARVHVETWRSAYAGILPDRVMVQMSIDDKAAAWRRLIQRQGHGEAVHVAIGDDRTLVGFASCGPSGPGMADYAGEIYTLYVLPDWQEQGIGRGLLCACFESLAVAGLDSVFLWVLADNPSRFFYEAMGGKQIGERDESLWGASVHELAYGWRRLSPHKSCHGDAGVD